jgi:hypothetical protein
LASDLVGNQKNLKPKKLWRTRSVRHSFLGFGFYYAYLLSILKSLKIEIRFTAKSLQS